MVLPQIMIEYVPIEELTKDVKMDNRKYSVLSLVVLIAGFVFASLAPASARECKETTSQSACERSTTCTWVKGYTISKGKQKGRKVSSYCRKKAAPKSDSKAASDKKMTDKGKSGTTKRKASASKSKSAKAGKSKNDEAGKDKSAEKKGRMNGKSRTSGATKRKNSADNGRAGSKSKPKAQKGDKSGKAKGKTATAKSRTADDKTTGDKKKKKKKSKKKKKGKAKK